MTLARTTPRPGWTVRQRVLALLVGMMALGFLLTGVISYALQVEALANRVDTELTQEVSELAALAQNGPMRDGVPYDNARTLFRAYLQTAVAGEDESVLTMIDGEQDQTFSGERPFEIFHEDVLAEVQASTLAPGQARITSLRTQGTTLRMVVADVQLPAETREAQFVVAIDIGRQQADINRRFFTYVGISLASLIVAGAIASLVLGRLLRPLRELREATAEVSSDALSRRVAVEGADTDVHEVAIRFNAMLDRIEDGVKQQRQFLDDAAHELRTPLTILRGNTELMRPGDAEEVATTRSLLLDEIDRMQRLVDDLLMLARSQRPDFLQVVPTDVTELAVDSMERVTSLGDRAWRLRADAEGTLPLDRQRVVQAVVQLASNAVRYSQEGSAIELQTRWVRGESYEGGQAREAGAQPAPRYLAIAVRDEGIGIPADQLARIFERFGRADNAPGNDGSGLGLAIVSAIVESHGGAVGLQSIERTGSTFTLWFPDQPSDGDDPAGVA